MCFLQLRIKLNHMNSDLKCYKRGPSDLHIPLDHKVMLVIKYGSVDGQKVPAKFVDI